MPRLWMAALCASLLAACHAPVASTDTGAEAANGVPADVVTADVGHFWEAYDAVTATADSARQAALLDSLFLRRGTPGLRALMERRGYTPESYLEAIRSYPLFWSSVRENTLDADTFAGKIAHGVRRLRALYPDLRPATVYFTVGALRTNGTTLDSLVLIGSELALAERTVVTDELPDRLGQSLRAFFDTDPVDDVVLLNVHEVVHTQQGPFGSTLLAAALQEGVAEYVSTRALGVPSATPAVAFGEANAERVRDRFATEMFSPNLDDWLYNDTSNAFSVRDLGYYVGYAIAEAYIRQAGDEHAAVARLIELDYQAPEAVAALVDDSGYFSRSTDELRDAYEQGVPTLVGIAEVENGARDVAPATDRLTLTFSEPMSDRFWGFDYGPLGEDHVLRIRRMAGFSEDGRTLTIEVDLAPDHRQQLTLSPRFRSRDGAALPPTVIDLTTTSGPDDASPDGRD